MKFHKWEPDVRCQILERLILLFFDFFQYLRFGREWRKWAGVAIIVSSTCTYIRLLKLVCSPQFFLKRRARSRGESVIEKTLLFFLSPCYFFRWLPLNWGCNDVNFLFLLHSFIYLVLKKSFILRIGTYYNSNSVRKLQLINLTLYTTLQYVACTFLDLCSQIVSKMRKLFFMTDKWVCILTYAKFLWLINW